MTTSGLFCGKSHSAICCSCLKLQALLLKHVRTVEDDGFSSRRLHAFFRLVPLLTRQLQEVRDRVDHLPVDNGPIRPRRVVTDRILAFLL